MSKVIFEISIEDEDTAVIIHAKEDEGNRVEDFRFDLNHSEAEEYIPLLYSFIQNLVETVERERKNKEQRENENRARKGIFWFAQNLDGERTLFANVELAYAYVNSIPSPVSVGMQVDGVDAPMKDWVKYNAMIIED